MSKLAELAKKINKDQGGEVITVGAKVYDSSRIPFTSPRVNYCMYGGLPVDKAVEFFGPEHSGKTTSALDIVANMQATETEKFLKQCSANVELVASLQTKGGKALDAAVAESKRLADVGPRKCVYVDAENTLDLKWAEKLGVDIDSMMLIKPDSQSAEQVLQMILDVIDTGECALVVLDSLAVLVPQNILNEDMEKKSYCGIAGPLTVFCSKISGTGKLLKNKTLLVGINQIREDISNPYNAYNSPGGKAWKHLCAVRILFRHGSFLDVNNEELAMKNAGTPFGNKVDFTIVKTKVCKPDRRLGFYTLRYETGIDAIADLIDLAIMYELIEKTGSWFVTYGGAKVQGKKALNQHYEDNYDEYLELEQEVKLKMGKD